MGCTFSKDSDTKNGHHVPALHKGRQTGKTSRRDSRANTPKNDTSIRAMHDPTSYEIKGANGNGTNASIDARAPFPSNSSNPAVNQNNNGGSTPPNNAGRRDADYKVLRQVVLDAEAVLKSLEISVEEKEFIALSFINTLGDVLRHTYRLKKEGLQEAIEDLCSDASIKIHRSVTSKFTHGAREEFLNHLLVSWTARNPSGAPTIPAELANEVLLENQIAPWKHTPMSFADCYRELLRVGDNAYANSIFTKYSEGNMTMTSHQFLKFLTECQHSDTATIKLAEEKTKERFGAVGTRFTFALYLQSLTLNTAQDPRRGGTVWQDMTQPLPQYMVRTSLVDTLDELSTSLSMGVRAIVLHCHEDENGVVMAGDASFDEMLHMIKEEGFAASNYPLMLCLAPEVSLTVSLQNRIAKSLTSILGDELIAKGMMFDGATINDPKFSPAALQHKVLILGSQAPLKPFVGFLVADMNRNGLGVKVTSVVAQTPAAKAGVQNGDWFTHINNEQITNKSHLKSILAKLQLGEEFTMRKENLEDVTIVVGGMVQGDELNSKELSGLIFLKFTQELGDNSPWDVCVVDPKNPSGRRTSNANIEDRKQAEGDSRSALSHYFRFTTLRNPPHEAVLSATHSGVQLICTTRNTEDQKWSRGFFTDNGACGYIQKSIQIGTDSTGFSITLHSPPPHFFNWSFAALRGTLFGEGSIEVDEERRVVRIIGTDDLSVCTFSVTLSPPASEEVRSSAVNHYVPSSPLKTKSDVAAKPVVLSVCFPVSILRVGIRSFASIEEKDEGKFATMPHYPILAEVASI